MPRVSFQDAQKDFEVNEGEVLYDALFDRGQNLPHGCLSGSCGACRVQITEGKENLQPPGVIEQNTISCLRDEFRQNGSPEGDVEIRLACRAKVTGNLSFRLIK
jgi:ferredoxin